MAKTKLSAQSPQIQRAPAAAPQVAPRPATPRPMPLGRAVAPLQRASCACGGEIGADGQCADCRARRERVQRKMTVNQPGDALEQEADQVARAHVQRQAAEEQIGGATVAPIQRQMDDEKKNGTTPSMPVQRQMADDVSATPDTRVQRQMDDQKKNGSTTSTPLQRQAGDEETGGTLSAPVQRAGNASVPAVTPAVESGIQGARGGGSALPPAVQRSMEDTMGANLSGVRVHHDGRADQLSRQLDARAFTSGQDIFFKQGEYNPESGRGRELLAHEAAHTVQQGIGTGQARRVQRQGDEAEAAPPPVEQEEQKEEQAPGDRPGEPAAGEEAASEAGGEGADEAAAPAAERPAQATGEAQGDEDQQEPSGQPAQPSQSEPASPPGALAPGRASGQGLGTSDDKLASAFNVPAAAAAESDERMTKEPGASPASSRTNGRAARGPLEETLRAPATAGSPVPTLAPAAPGEGAAAATPEARPDAARPEGAANAPEEAGAAPGASEAGSEGAEGAAAPEVATGEGESGNGQAPAAAESGPESLMPFLAGRAQGLDEEAEEAAKAATQRSPVEMSGAPTSTIQRGLLSSVTGAARSGAGWVSDRVVGPIMQLVSSGWGAIRGLGGQMAAAYQQADANAWDIVQPAYLGFRMMRIVRRQLSAQALQEESRQRAQAIAEGRLSPEAAAEPSVLQRADSVAETLEGVAERGFGIQREIIEGAVVGDFNENPTIWNTIGQIAIGFVPYAGQVADLRDLVASIKKLSEGGWRDPWEWFNLVLVGVGIIPGVGDAIKAAGRGLKGVIRRGAGWVMRNGSRLWRGIVRRLPGMVTAARRFGRRLLQGARNLGRRVLQGARALGQRAVGAVRRGAQAVRGVVGRVGGAIRGLASRVGSGARSVLGRARGLLGRIAGGISGAARRALDAARGLATRGANLVRQAIQRGRALIARIGRRISELARRVADDLRMAIREAIERGRRMLRRAWEAATGAIRRAIQRGRALATQGYNRVRNYIRHGLRWVRGTAIPWVRNRLRALKERILNFLRRMYYRITRTRPSHAPGPGHTPTGTRARPQPKDDAATVRSLARENDSADALARAGYRVEQKPAVPGLKRPDYRIEGRIFDNMAPSTNNPRAIWKRMLDEKIATGQAQGRVVLNLSDSAVDINALRRQFNDWPMPGLKEVIIVRGNTVIPFWP